MSSPLRPVRLTEELTIQTAAENKAVIVAALGWGTDIEIDLGKVTEIDTAGIQLLLLAKREAELLGIDLRLRPPTPPVRETLDIVGLEANLDSVARPEVPRPPAEPAS